MEVSVNAFAILDPAGREHNGSEAASMLPEKMNFSAVDHVNALGESLSCFPLKRPAGIFCACLSGSEPRSSCIFGVDAEKCVGLLVSSFLQVQS